MAVISETKFRVQRKGGYTVLPNALLRDPRLSIKAKGLACLTLSLPPGWEYSVAGLASICGCGRDLIRGALKELEQAGYLSREQIHDGNGKFGSCRYVMCDESACPEEPLEAPVGVPLSDFPSTGKPTTEKPLTGNPTELNKEISSKDLSISPKAPQGGRRSREPKEAPDWKPERFTKLWAYYPRGEAKQAAIRAWDKLRPSDELIDTMAQALKRQVASEGWKQGIGIPYLSTWINQKRWTDEKRQAPAGQAPPGRVVEEEGAYYL